MRSPYENTFINLSQVICFEDIIVSSNSKHCFVIMPFSKTSDEHTEEYWTKHFESFLRPLIKECGDFNVFRSKPLRGDILIEIIENLANAPLVIADLTDYNPNVFWELGVRQSFKHGTITIAEEGTKIPFNISTKSVLSYYPKDYQKNEEFREQFKDSIEDWLSNPDFPDSLVLETIGREIYNDSMKRLLHHATNITDHLRLLTDPDNADKASRIIPREVNTIKDNLRKFYPFCHRSVQKVIDNLSEKGTIICGFISIEQLLKHRSSIGYWVSTVKDVRLNIKTSPFQFCPDVYIDLSLIKF